MTRLCLRWTVVVLVLTAVAVHGQSYSSGTSPTGFGVFAAETGGAFLGEVTAAAGSMVLVMGIGWAAGMDLFDESSWPLGVVWSVSLLPAVPAGSALGTRIVGRHYGEKGGFWGAALGCLAGVGAGGILFIGGVNLERLWWPAGVPFYVAAAVSPAVGTTIGYRLTRPQGGLGARFEPGSLSLAASSDEDGLRLPALNIRLLTVRF